MCVCIHIIGHIITREGCNRATDFAHATKEIITLIKLLYHVYA